MRIKLINYLKKTFIKDLYDKDFRIRNFFRFINRTVITIVAIVTRSTIKQSFSKHSYREYLLSPNPQSLMKLKDTHSGDVCFVIGNGPSLTSSDLDKLKNFTTFGSNFLFEMNDFLPTYYFVQDFKHLKNKQLLEKVREISPKTSFTFLPFNIITNKQKKHFDNIIYFYLNLPNVNSRSFSFDISQYIEEGGTVTYSILQCAIYMGFKSVYLLGVDNNHNVGNFYDAGHFYDPNPINECYHKPNESMEKSYQYLKSLLPSNLKIINCTRGGTLEVFERKSLDKVINDLK